MKTKVAQDTQSGINSFIAARLILNDFGEDYISSKYELKGSFANLESKIKIS